jgi:hypothetical protein
MTAAYDILCTMPPEGLWPSVNPSVTITLADLQSVGVDVSEQLTGVNAPLNVTSTLLTADGVSIPLGASPTVSGNVIVQVVNGDLLTQYAFFYLDLTWTNGPAGSRFAARVTIECPF